MSKVEVEVREGVLWVSGELDKTSVPCVARDGMAQLQQITGDVVVDLSSLVRADSSGLAMLVEWMRLARIANKSIRYRNIPSQLMDIARVSGLEDILPIESP